MARGKPTAEAPRVPAAAAELLALPPRGFTAARDALARELAARGDPAAAAVRKLRRPVGLAWLLNHLARNERQTVEALLRAGDRLGAAQAAALAGRGAGDFRAAEEDLRATARQLRLSAARALAGAGGSGAPGALAHLEVALRSLAAAPAELRERFRDGLLEREPEVAAVVLSGAAQPAAPARRPPPQPEPLPHPRPGRAAARRAGSDAKVARRDEAARARREAAERRQAEKEARARAREEAKARAEAARALERAEERAAHARQELTRAEARASAARAALAAAEADVERRRGALQQTPPGPGGGNGTAPHPLPSADDAAH